MKKIIIIISIVCLSKIANAESTKCQTMLQKLNPDCNFIGKGAKKLKQISKENKTIDQTFNKIKEKIKN